MSYTISLDGDPCPTCGQHIGPKDTATWAPTYNLWRVFDYAMFGEVRNPLHRTADLSDIRWLSGRLAGETVERLDEALTRLLDPNNTAIIHTLLPANKWGTHDDAVQVMTYLRDCAKKYPKHRWRIS